MSASSKKVIIAALIGNGLVAITKFFAAPGVGHVNEVLTMHVGPEYILANLSLDFADHLTAADLEAGIADLDRRIKEALPRVKRVFVEAEARRGLHEPV